MTLQKQALYTNFLKLMKKYNLSLHKLSSKLGQHFLIDEHVIKREIEIAGVSSNDTILEIGAGLGFLTRYLLKSAKKVVAIELDRTLFKILTSEFMSVDNLVLMYGDILKISKLPNFSKIVSNIPYNITTPLFDRMLSWNFSSATLIIQYDVAKRLMANPGSKEYGRLTVFIKTTFDISLFDIISPKSFYPPPKVLSQIIKLVPLQKRFTWSPLARDVLITLFNRKHKKIKNNLKFFFIKHNVSEILAQKIKNQISEYLNRRSVNLSINEILYIVNAIESIMADTNE